MNAATVRPRPDEPRHHASTVAGPRGQERAIIVCPECGYETTSDPVEYRLEHVEYSDGGGRAFHVGVFLAKDHANRSDGDER